MKWTWLVLFFVTAVAGVIILRACPKQTEVAESSPTPTPAVASPIPQVDPTPDMARGNGPLSMPDTGAPKAPEQGNSYPVYPGVSPTPQNNPGYNPNQNYTPPAYQPPPPTNYQPPTYNEPGFDPNTVPPPPPPPPEDFDGNIPPPAFEPPEEFNDPNYSQPYNPED